MATDRRKDKTAVGFSAGCYSWPRLEASYSTKAPDWYEGFHATQEKPRQCAMESLSGMLKTNFCIASETKSELRPIERSANTSTFSAIDTGGIDYRVGSPAIFIRPFHTKRLAAQRWWPLRLTAYRVRTTTGLPARKLALRHGAYESLEDLR